jgi:hypothetical protein
MNVPILLLTSLAQEMSMRFTGDLDYRETRSPGQTTTILLQRCLGCPKGEEAGGIGKFLEGLSIKPAAFFSDIDGDWAGRPFLGQHAFKVLQAAGYQGTEHDLWYSVTGRTAPYKVRKSAVAVPKTTPRRVAAAHRAP